MSSKATKSVDISIVAPEIVIAYTPIILNIKPIHPNNLLSLKKIIAKIVVNIGLELEIKLTELGEKFRVA